MDSIISSLVEYYENWRGERERNQRLRDALPGTIQYLEINERACAIKHYSMHTGETLKDSRDYVISFDRKFGISSQGKKHQRNPVTELKLRNAANFR